MKSAHPLHEEELMAYLDGELRPDLASVAAVHLETCGECRATAADLRELSHQLAAWEVQLMNSEIPPAVNAAVEMRVKAQKKRMDAHQRSWRQIVGMRRAVWLTGSAVALLLVGFLITRERPAAELGHLRSYSGPVGAVPAPPPPPPRANGQGAGVRSRGFAADSNGLLHGLDDQAQNSFSVDGQPFVAHEGKVLPNQVPSDSALAPNGPMIVRTAELALETKEFDRAHSAAEEILRRHGGYIGQLTVDAPAGSGRTLTATFRVPAAQLDAAMSELKRLGRVQNESQAGEEVTQQYVDLEARLGNARHTEQRLSELLSNRTGKLSDVLAFEKEIDRVRGEIESMEAQRKSLAKQVSYATLSAVITEDYSQQLQVVPPSTSTRFRNAAVDGYRALSDGIVSLLLFMLSAGPSILIWGGILLLVGRVIWKKLRRRIA